jgi:hypothetical protein
MVEKNIKSIKMINLSNLPKWSQAVIHWAWVLLCVGIAAVLDYLVTALSNGAITLPDSSITLPLVGIALGELDTWFVKYEKTIVPTV